MLWRCAIAAGSRLECNAPKLGRPIDPGLRRVPSPDAARAVLAHNQLLVFDAAVEQGAVSAAGTGVVRAEYGDAVGRVELRAVPALDAARVQVTVEDRRDIIRLDRNPRSSAGRCPRRSSIPAGRRCVA
jgi:hypothetical protein